MRRRRNGFLQRQGATTLVAGIILFVALLGAALAAPALTSYQPSRNNITARLRPPFWETDRRAAPPIFSAPTASGATC